MKFKNGVRLKCGSGCGTERMGLKCGTDMGLKCGTEWFGDKMRHFKLHQKF
jgi:hypothetical protein